MFSKNLIFVAVFLLGLFSISCSEYNKVLKSTDLEYKYQKTIEYYKDEKYYKALPLLEELVSVYRGHKRAEELNYYYAYTDYYLGDLLLAAYKFNKFTKTYPTSQYAEECQFMSAYSQYLMSPNFSLDQTNTYKAISELQLFIDRYPRSTRVDSCNTLVVELERKLEEKAFNDCNQYLKMDDYRAAISSYNNLLNDFPDTKYRENAYFLILKASYHLANKSTFKKKGKRIEDAMKAYITFVDRYPKSSKLKEAEGYYDNLNKLKEKIKIKNS